MVLANPTNKQTERNILRHTAPHAGLISATEFGHALSQRPSATKAAERNRRRLSAALLLCFAHLVVRYWGAKEAKSS